MTKISDSELEVLEMIWEIDDWVDIAQVHQELSKENKWAYNTVGTFMIRLEEKGFLTHEKRGKTNYYRVIVSREEYKLRETEKFLKQVHSGSKKSLIAALFQGQAEEEELNKLLQMVKEMDSKE